VVCPICVSLLGCPVCFFLYADSNGLEPESPEPPVASQVGQSISDAPLASRAVAAEAVRPTTEGRG
jgi:hypothetical protein